MFESKSVPSRFYARYQNDQALKRWYTKLKSKAAGTRSPYLRAMSIFCSRFDYTPTSLFEARMFEVQSTNPLEWGIIRDQVLQIMREMTEGNYYDPDDPWSQEALDHFREVKAMEPQTCKQVAKAVTNFFETFGARMEIRLKAKDMPQGDSMGSRPIPISELREVLKHGGREMPYRNVAIVLNLLAWGPRVSDLGILTVGDYLRAREDPVFNEFGEPFISVQPERTVKEGLLCRPHFGPEAIVAVDRYLAVERVGAGFGEPLIVKYSKFDGSRGAINGASASHVGQRMIIQGCGETVLLRTWTPHSIRKTWSTLIQAGGMPKDWAKYI